MSLTMAYLSDVGLVALLSLGLVAYVKEPLRSLLIELCGTKDRASFWLAFSNVALVLTPLIFALGYTPEAGPEKSVIFEMAAQFKYALIGFVAALGAIGLVLFRFIPRDKSSVPARPAV
jgi:hypothetical protein